MVWTCGSKPACHDSCDAACTPATWHHGGHRLFAAEHRWNNQLAALRLHGGVRNTQRDRTCDSVRHSRSSLVVRKAASRRAPTALRTSPFDRIFCCMELKYVARPESERDPRAMSPDDPIPVVLDTAADPRVRVKRLCTMDTAYDMSMRTTAGYEAPARPAPSHPAFAQGMLNPTSTSPNAARGFTAQGAYGQQQGNAGFNPGGSRGRAGSGGSEVWPP
eukprot:366277-Chlamydomonas_euryale.AAC.5